MPGADAFPTARQLALIVSVADSGSVSAAAKALSISQPAVTAQLRAAEQTVGQQLFVRTRTGLVPTAAGRAMTAFARRQLSLRRGLIATMSRFKEGDAGTLIVGGSTTPSEHWLPERLAELRRRYPEVDIRVLVGNSEETLERLETGAIDVAAVGARKRIRGITFAAIAADRIVAVAAPGSRWSRGELRPRTLADAAFIVREEGSATRECGLACLRRAGVVPRRLMPVASNEAVARMTSADLGIGILPLHAAQRSVDGGSLAYVRIHGWKCRRQLYVARRNDVKNRLVDAFWSVAVKRPRSS